MVLDDALKGMLGQLDTRGLSSSRTKGRAKSKHLGRAGGNNASADVPVPDLEMMARSAPGDLASAIAPSSFAAIACDLGKIDPQLELRSSPSLLAFAPAGHGPGVKSAAKPIDEAALQHVLARIEALSSCPECDRVKVLLAHRAGLRPCEIAGLTWRTLLTASGELRDVVEVMGGTSKREMTRPVHMHPELRAALLRQREAHPTAERVAFRILKNGEIKYQRADYLTQWFTALYRGAGLIGCAGMTGRHSFATELQKYVPPAAVQKALGHKRLTSTAFYIQPFGNLEEAIGKLGSER